MTLRLSLILGCFVSASVYSPRARSRGRSLFCEQQKNGSTGVQEKEMVKKAKAKRGNKSHQRVAVLDLNSTEENADYTCLNGRTLSTVSMIQGYKAISRNDLQALLTQMETAQVLGCDDVKYAVSIAKAAKADLVVWKYRGD